ncbi:MAG: hypothetical protein ACLFQH_10335, partial [Halothiobacillaceae bacterium]
EEERRLAFVRERALRDEVSYLKEAREEGEKIGEERGREEEKRVTARNLLKMMMLTDEQVAEATGLSLREIQALRVEMKN